eukprot:symbB.v1.2.040220.t1/scaffold7039.1/size14331/1
MFWFKDMNNRSHFVLSLLVILLWISSLGIMVKQNKEALTQVAKEGIKPKDVHVETSTPAVATPEVPSASPTATTESAPIKVKTIIFKCLIDTDVGEVFKQDAQSMTSERKAEMIKELETEVKSLMLKRHHLMNMNDAVTSASSKETMIVTFRIIFDGHEMATIKMPSTETVASFREMVLKHYGLPKTHARQYALTFLEQDMCETARTSVGGIMKKMNIPNDAKIKFMKYK